MLQPETDIGPEPHGATFDLDFSGIPPRRTVTFDQWYGAAGFENLAEAYLSYVGAEMWSLSHDASAPDLDAGTPHTFVWGYKR